MFLWKALIWCKEPYSVQVDETTHMPLYYSIMPFHTLFTSTKCRSCAPGSKWSSIIRRSEYLLVDVRAINNCKASQNCTDQRCRQKNCSKQTSSYWHMSIGRAKGLSYLFHLNAQADCGQLHDVFNLLTLHSIHAHDAIALYFAPAWI